MSTGRRTRAVLALPALLGTAFLCGLAFSLLKGDQPGLRGAIGNLSAPWLLVALIPGSRATSLVRGALIGLASTWVALVGFYLAQTVLLSGHLGAHGFLSEFAVETSANRLYLVAGTLTGPLLGAAGAWLGRRGGRAVAVAAGALMLGELAAVAVAQGHQLAPPPFYFSWAVDDWRPYVGEAVLGLGVLVVTVARRGRRRDTPVRTHV